MMTTQYYPVLQVRDVANTAAFYRRSAASALTSPRARATLRAVFGKGEDTS
jgi:hypothetical protein